MDPLTRAKTKEAPRVPDEPEGVLCLGGPKHNRTVAWRGEVWTHRDGIQEHIYRWVKLALSRGETALTKSLYVHDSQDAL
jgi:hypothetical protein